MLLALRRSRWLLAVAGLVALLAGAAGSLGTPLPAAADGHGDAELVISLDNDSDNIVAPGGSFNVSAQLRYSGPAGLESK